MVVVVVVVVVALLLGVCERVRTCANVCVCVCVHLLDNPLSNNYFFFATSISISTEYKKWMERRDQSISTLIQQTLIQQVP